MNILTMEEKMEHFTSITIENALKHSADVLEDYRKSAEKRFEAHKANQQKAAEEEEKMAKEGVKRQASKEFTMEQLHIRRKHNHKQEELKEKLFAEVAQMLEDFKGTEQYKELLVRYINEAKKLAGDNEIHMYIDSTDEGIKAYLEQTTGVELAISEISLGGGIKAEIPSRNMLIDNAFASKLEEIREKYIIGIN